MSATVVPVFTTANVVVHWPPPTANCAKLPISEDCAQAVAVTATANQIIFRHAKFVGHMKARISHFTKAGIFGKNLSKALCPQCRCIQDLLGHLTPEQKQLFDEGTKAFNAQRYADAFATFKQMLAHLQGDPVISKFASEAALDIGEASFCDATLKPLAATDPARFGAAVRSPSRITIRRKNDGGCAAKAVEARRAGSLGSARRDTIVPLPCSPHRR
jgi:hypothetical protein